MPSLLHKTENTFGEAALVSISSNCFEDGVNVREITFLFHASLTRWELTSICLVLMELLILCDIDSRLIITKHKHRAKMTKIKLQ